MQLHLPLLCIPCVLVICDHTWAPKALDVDKKHPSQCQVYFFSFLESVMCLLLCPSFHFWFLIFVLSLLCIGSLRKGLSLLWIFSKKKKKKKEEEEEEEEEKKKKKTALAFLDFVFFSLFLKAWFQPWVYFLSSDPTRLSMGWGFASPW